MISESEVYIYIYIWKKAPEEAGSRIVSILLYLRRGARHLLGVRPLPAHGPDADTRQRDTHHCTRLPQVTNKMIRDRKK